MYEHVFDDHVAHLALALAASTEKAARLLDEHEPLDALRIALGGRGQMALGDGPSDTVEEALRTAAAREREWAERGIHVVTAADGDFPLNLQTVHDAPPALTYRGRLGEDDVRSVAVVGTRTASQEGCRRAAKLAKGLVEAGCVVVSGLAAGIDAAAHNAALEAGGRTVAVIGTGLDHTFPAAHRDLQARIAHEHLVVSQFPPETRGARWTFPLRNRVMSGFARATVVVEASQTSGARLQANMARDHGRQVVLLRSLVDEHAWARELAAADPGVLVAEQIEDVVQRLDALLGTARVF